TFAAASEKEIGPKAPAENPTLKPSRFNADEPICLLPRFDTLGGKACPPRPPRPGVCASIGPIMTPTPIIRAAATILFFIFLCPFSPAVPSPLVAQNEIHHRLRILARQREVTLALGH